MHIYIAYILVYSYISIDINMLGKVKDSFDVLGNATSNAILNVKGSARRVLRGNGPLRKITVTVGQAQDLVCMNDKGRADPFVEVSLGGYQIRQTSTAFKNLDPVFNETFELALRSLEGKESMLSVIVYNTDVLSMHELMGSVDIDIGKMQIGERREEWFTLTHAPQPNKKGLKRNKDKGKDVSEDGTKLSIGEGPGRIHLTIAVEDMYEKELSPLEIQEVKKNYCGWLKVHVMQATGLDVKEGSCDPYCVVRLGNKVYRTDVIKGSKEPKWDKLIQVPVKDLFDAVEINIMNDDRRGATDYIGGILVPIQELLSSNGETVWYSLKDENHLSFINETSAIRVAFHMTYNLPLGALSLFQKRDARHVDDAPPFSFRKTRALAERLKGLAFLALDGLQLFDRAMNFEFGWKLNAGVLVGWIIFWVIIELYMIPFFAALGIIGYGYHLRTEKKKKETVEVAVAEPTADAQGTAVANAAPTSPTNQDAAAAGNNDLDEAEEEVSLLNPEAIRRRLEKVARMQGTLQIAQNLLEQGFDNVERVNNLTNWKFPILSAIITVSLFSAAVVMMFLPLRLIPILAGIALFAQSAYLHYLPMLRNAPKKSRQRQIIEFLRNMPSPIHIAINVFYKLPSDDDLCRRENEYRNDIEITDENRDGSIKIKESLEHDAAEASALAAAGSTKPKSE